MKVVHVLRKPCSEKSVAQNVLKQGCGGLNIDNCRVGQDSTIRPLSLTMGYHGKATGLDYVVCGSQAGRWPANLILQHKESCKQIGTQKVKPTNGSGMARHGNSQAGNVIYGRGIGGPGLQNHPDLGYVDADGTETVVKWECQEECPAKELDEQGGKSITGLRKLDSKNAIVIGTTFGVNNHKSREYPNEDTTGGASRFFKNLK